LTYFTLSGTVLDATLLSSFLLDAVTRFFLYFKETFFTSVLLSRFNRHIGENS